ncbi:Yip1 family protein [Anaerocolumna sp. AGMB13020]|uniref:Yip1 family protein n=1 Tax=Anaerocolumna sp. AGMB13020 TaxID=3081750 RepID=UPI002955A5C3|nr:Yip1 family protein [Anaerocolumna sp. AGMB13020]WOO36870.1 Yip1 family protein [Anaerocolumna sp. AGMB13020]
MKNKILKEQLHYLKYAMFHPFDGFYEIKYRGKGSALIASVILILYGIMQCVSYQYTGFVMNMNAIFQMNSVSIFISALSVFLLFTVSNWTITTLFNGKGNMRDIYIVLGYSVVPMLLLNGLTVFISNFVITEEIIILRSLQGIGVVWFVFILLAGLCIIHEYSFAVNIKTLLATAVAAFIIVFLGILFFSLMERMYYFVMSVAQEMVRRIN